MQGLVSMKISNIPLFLKQRHLFYATYFTTTYLKQRHLFYQPLHIYAKKNLNRQLFFFKISKTQSNYALAFSS